MTTPADPVPPDEIFGAAAPVYESRPGGDRDKVNLLEDTLAVLRSNGREPRDVSHVAWGDPTVKVPAGWCRWAHFEPVAARITYDRGYGSAFVASSLTVVGIDGWWLERHEYDGSEWWEYKSCPAFPATEGRPPTVGDLLNGYHGLRPSDVVVAEELPLADPEDAPPPPPGSEADLVRAAWARVTDAPAGLSEPSRLDLSPRIGGGYLVAVARRGQAAQAELPPEVVAVPRDLEQRLRRLYGDLLQKLSYAYVRNLKRAVDLPPAPTPVPEPAPTSVPEPAPQPARIAVPPEDVPAIMAHFWDVTLRSTGLGRPSPVEPAAPGRRHVFQGEADVERDDGGQALIYTLSNAAGSGLASEKMFVRVQGWDETGEHRDLKALGTRLKVTVEPMPEE